MSNLWKVCVFLCLWCNAATAQLIDETRQPQGLKEHAPGSYAITGAKLVIGDGRIIENGVLVVHDEKIQAIGTAEEVPVPLGFTKIDAAGRTIYPGLIDAYLPISVAPVPTANRYWNSRIRAEVDVRQSLTPEVLNDATRRSQGIVAALFVPSGAIIDGTGAVASLGGSDASAVRQIIRSEVGQHGVLTVTRGPRPAPGADTVFDGYPGSPMGAVALARQAMYDARWYRDAWQVVKVDQTVPLPETNVTLEALEPLVGGERSLFVQTGNELAVLRADRFAREFGVGLVVVGSGREYRRIAEVAATGRAVICPLNFPPAPNVASIADARAATLESLMHWDHAPENPARLAEKRVKMAFTSMGLESASTFLAQLRTAVQRGLSADAALKALTVDAAELLGVSDQLGTLARGKLASFIVTDGDLFGEKSKIMQTWVAGKLHEIKPTSNLELAGRWRFQAAATGEFPAWEADVEVKSKGDQWTVQPASEPAKPTEEVAKADPADAPAADAEKKKDDAKPTIKFDRVQMEGLVWNGTVQGKSLPVEGVARWSLVIEEPKSDRYFGRLVWANGSQTALVLERVIPETKSESPETAPAPATAPNAESSTPPPQDTAQTENSPAPPTTQESAPASDASGSGDGAKTPKETAPRRASYAINYPLGMYGRSEVPALAASVLFRDFMVWTSGPEGTLDHGSVLIGQGKIQQVFRNLDELNAAALPEGTIVVEGQGRHLSPGLIDCHSHMATDSGVNEGTQSITAEVRIGDFVDCNDITIYRQLAGGLTAANVLHGSANPIGGQNQVIKLRWGALDEELKLREAPQGIKFALGENVKRSNGTQVNNRYPGSRMGVEQIIRDAFYAATEYRLRHRQWNDRKTGLPPRVDLELEALSEIIDGKRWVHCHSYRQDEILALIRTMDSFNIQIGTLQHIMEGYKVADAMANHGAMASAFADWWAYKLEVADAIPYAGSIMHDQGVVVSFNSDDGELGRRMNLEAAKAIKYGGIAPAEALKFVTLNPAKQLRIDQHVGSLEVGKHADIVVWTGSPLSTLSRVEQTWIDGRKYFDHAADVALQKEQESWRQSLIQKVLETGSAMGAPGEEIDKDPSRDWPRFDEFCRAKGQ